MARRLPIGGRWRDLQTGVTGGMMEVSDVIDLDGYRV